MNSGELYTDEVIFTDFLSGDHINKFENILRSNTIFSPESVFFNGAMEFLNPAPNGHIQILGTSNSTHWE